MLSLTENAAAAICDLFSRSDNPGTGGLRIARSPNRGLALATAAEPVSGDEVVEQQGARVFLEPEAAAALDGKVLDASVDLDGRLRFKLTAQ